MAKNKTTEILTSVNDFINAVRDETKRKDSLTLIELIKKQTGLEPKMWGTSIVGFGSYHSKYESGHEGYSPLDAFFAKGFTYYTISIRTFDKREELLEKLGKHKTDKGCIYLKKLEDTNMQILEKMIVNHIKHIRNLYPNK